MSAPGLLRFITCGSVDDGKSTMIGRLLCDSKALHEDQLAAVASDSKRWGTQGDAIDFALLVDGLGAEREQSITIDVAYRYFSTPARKFIVADTPGHEQYTRNMVTGASTADLAILLVDARKGLLEQTRRHAFLVALLGIRDVVLAVNKMDLVGYSADVFATLVEQYRVHATKLPAARVVAIPLSAVHGDNLVDRSDRTPWYEGPTLLDHLERVDVQTLTGTPRTFRFPVQWVNRPSPDFRGFAGTIVSGSVVPGAHVRVLPSARESRVARIVTADGDLTEAEADRAVTITLEDEIDVSRGDVLVSTQSPPEVADQLEATIVWMGDEPMFPGRSYLIKLGAQIAGSRITELKHKLDPSTTARLAAKHLVLNEIGVVNVAVDRPVVFDPYEVNRDTGGFILIDRLTNQTVGAGLIHFALRRANNIHRQAVDVNQAARAASLQQRPCVLWFTGLSGAGKSTVANWVEKKLHLRGRHTYLLDGDNLRRGLNKDLGFTEADRVENIRRVAEVARLLVDAGLIVLAAFISPFRAEREMARALLSAGEFVEIYVDTPLAVAESRDVKGLYGKARRGELKNFTGIDSPYEPPEHPDLRLNTIEGTAEDAADRVIERMVSLGLLNG